MTSTFKWTINIDPAFIASDAVISDNNITFTTTEIITTPPANVIAFKGMAIGNTFDINGATSKTFPYTVNAASSALLVELAGDGPACFNGGLGRDDITSVTYNGVAMTLLAKRISNVWQRFHYVYGMMNPPTGVHNVVVSWTNVHDLRMNAADYSGVTGFGATTVNANNICSSGGTPANTLTTSLTTTAANSWIFLGSVCYANGGAPNAGSGAVFRGSNAAGYMSVFDSGVPIATPSSQSMVINHANSVQALSHIAVELKN